MRKIIFPNFHFGIEKWKYCMALDVYVSSYGRIKNRNGEIEKLCSKNNYLYYKGKAVHRLVAQTFAPVPNYANLTVDHKDHNTRNNRLNNLEWVTAEENIKRAKEDYNDNAPENNPEPLTGPQLFVMMNNIKMPLKMAKDVMKADKGLMAGGPNVGGKIDSLFAKISSTKKFEYGNYTVILCM